jgi:hypothetical protein
MRTISKDDYLKVSQIFDWATREHYTVWFTGKMDRHRRTEVMLPRLVEKGKLQAVKYGNRLVYCAPKFTRSDRKLPELINHGLGVTEGLVRFWRSDMSGTIIPSRFFRGLGSVPEWGIQYNQSVLLYEYSTRDNFYQTIQEKINRYTQSLEKLQEKFGRKVLVVFILAIHQGFLLNWLTKYQPDGPFMFTDDLTFRSIPVGAQLTAPIYFWGGDGQPYSLKTR